MMYAKERAGLTQDQALENLQAVLNSDYFKGYDCKSVRFFSDLVSMDLRKGCNAEVPLKVGDIAETVATLLRAGSRHETLNETLIDAVVEMTPTAEMLRQMQFEPRVYEEEGFELPVNVSVRGEGKPEHATYRFSVVNLGLKQSHFESEGLDFKSAQAKMTHWYTTMNNQLKRILPWKVGDPTP